MSFVLASAALRQIGPIARTRELRASGVAKRELARAAREGEILKVRQGVYCEVGTADILVHAACRSPSASGKNRSSSRWNPPYGRA